MFRPTLAFTLVLAVGAAACAPAPAPTAPAAKPQSVTIVHGSPQIEVTHPGLYLTNALGFFKEENLEVTVQTSEGSQQAVQLLAAGKADFIQVNPETVINAREQGVKATTVYSAVTHHNARIGVLADGPIQKVADLKDKQIGVLSMAAGGTHYLKALVKDAGLDPEKDVKLVATGAGAPAAQALASGQVAALSLWVGAFAGLENQGYKFRYFAWEGLKDAPGHVVATSEELLQRDPALVGKVGRAMAKAAVFAFANSEATVREHWKMFPQAKAANLAEDVALKNDSNTVQAQLQTMRTDDRPDKRWGWNDPAGWKALSDYLIATGVQKAPISMESLYSNQAVDEYNKLEAAKIQERAKSHKP